jgi:hypothetical protein
MSPKQRSISRWNVAGLLQSPIDIRLASMNRKLPTWKAAFFFNFNLPISCFRCVLDSFIAEPAVVDTKRMLPFLTSTKWDEYGHCDGLIIILLLTFHLSVL